MAEGFLSGAVRSLLGGTAGSSTLNSSQLLANLLKEAQVKIQSLSTNEHLETTYLVVSKSVSSLGDLREHSQLFDDPEKAKRAVQWPPSNRSILGVLALEMRPGVTFNPDTGEGKLPSDWIARCASVRFIELEELTERASTSMSGDLLRTYEGPGGAKRKPSGP